MIIVKTKTGTHFVNEKLTKKVWHDKDNSRVWIGRDGEHVEVIDHVAAVTFVSDAQPMEFQEEGNVIEELKTNLKKMYDEHLADTIKMESEKNELENKVARLRAKLRDFGCEL